MSIKSLFGGIVNESPVPLASRWGRGSGVFNLGAIGGRGRSGELGSMSATATLYGVITKLAQITSAPTWSLDRKPARPGDEPIPLAGARAENAAPLKVLNKPNPVPFMTRKMLFAAAQQHKDLCGEFYWVVTKFMGTPVEIWPVRPDRMHPVPGERTLVVGYVYRSPDGEEIPLELSDVIVSIGVSDPNDMMRGISPIGALAADLAQSEAQSAWQNSLYRNSANPGGIIKVGRKLGDDEWEQLVERWRMEHQGVQNAGRVAVLEEGDFTPISYSQKDMQFVESRNLTRQAVFDAYGFPKFGIGDVDDVNRASADASLALLAQTLAVPRLTDFREVLNEQFLPMFGPLWRNYEFNYANPVPPDAETDRLDLTARTNAFSTLVGAGVHEDDAAEVCQLPAMRFEKPEPKPLPGQDPNDPNADEEENEDDDEA